MKALACHPWGIYEHLPLTNLEKTVNAVVESKSGAHALAQAQAPGRMAVSEIIGHVSMVQEVMRAVMKENVHFGVIPGTDKPTLYKAGAEVLCMAFRVADSYAVEDLSSDGMVRYRVTCTGTHQVTGFVLGTGMGEASSGEEKYKWRKAYDDEFEVTPEHLRRIKLGKYKTKQVRTEPADLANTILKMANKRAKMAMVLNVTAASDCFSQDLEDMDDALRDHLTRHTDDVPVTATPQTAQLPAYTDEDFAKNLPAWRGLIESGKKTAAQIISTVSTKAALSEDQKALILATVVNEAQPQE
jgi:hypothetical protein